MKTLRAYSQVNGELTFAPKFQIIATDFKVVADIINRPHEDYPHRVEATKNLIETIISSLLKDYGNTYYSNEEIINSHTIRMIHSCIMGITDEKNGIYPLDSRGTYRLNEVTIANNVTSFVCPPSKIQERMEKITPVYLNTNLLTWYMEFQTIHPFEDGNGRVGGIILAIVSSLIIDRDQGNIRLSPNILVPCQ